MGDSRSPPKPFPNEDAELKGLIEPVVKEYGGLVSMGKLKDTLRQEGYSDKDIKDNVERVQCQSPIPDPGSLLLSQPLHSSSNQWLTFTAQVT